MMQPIHEAQATRLKDDLLRPEAFAAVAPTEKVSLVETHISWVYLLDRDVFKVKKPVDLGFLNFASREQRREACEEEVRLNVRLAPGVYRGLVPITRGLDGRCVVGGVGRVIDWAVHMERLSDDRASRHAARPRNAVGRTHRRDRHPHRRVPRHRPRRRESQPVRAALGHRKERPGKLRSDAARTVALSRPHGGRRDRALADGLRA